MNSAAAMRGTVKATVLVVAAALLSVWLVALLGGFAPAMRQGRPVGEPIELAL